MGNRYRKEGREDFDPAVSEDCMIDRLCPYPVSVKFWEQEKRQNWIDGWNEAAKAYANQHNEEIGLQCEECDGTVFDLEHFLEDGYCTCTHCGKDNYELPKTGR